MICYSRESFRRMSQWLCAVSNATRQKLKSPAANASVIFPIFGREAVEIKAEGGVKQ